MFLKKSLSPNLSEDLAISFYLQSHKLIIAVYQLTNVHGTMRFDSRHAEAPISWLNDVLLLLNDGLLLCQQLKDKVNKSISNFKNKNYLVFFFFADIGIFIV